jgi:hypothetical protein
MTIAQRMTIADIAGHTADDPAQAGSSSSSSQVG